MLKRSRLPTQLKVYRELYKVCITSSTAQCTQELYCDRQEVSRYAQVYRPYFRKDKRQLTLKE